MPRVVFGLLVLEFPLTVALLVLFGVATPDAYRTKLWEDGAKNRFNSHPSAILYAYANYRPVKVPLVWSQFITNFNVVIVVMSLFFLLAKSTLYLMHVLFPVLSLLLHCLLAALYAFSVYGQTSADLLDPQHPAMGPPWYISKDCSVASTRSNVGYCQQAKSAFFVTVFMLALFSFHITFALWSFLCPKKPSVTLVASPGSNMPDDNVYGSPESYVTTEEKWEMGQMPKSPMSPRTVAFRTLAGQS